MKKLITSMCIIMFAMLSCKTMSIKKMDFESIDNFAFWKCVGDRIERLQSEGYKPTHKGYRGIQSFCYYHLKSVGIIK